MTCSSKKPACHPRFFTYISNQQVSQALFSKPVPTLTASLISTLIQADILSGQAGYVGL